jgi:hypothetical protein
MKHEWPIDIAVSPVTELLVGGRANVAKGWCQNVYRRGDNVCILGAIGFSNAKFNEISWRAVVFLEQATHWRDISQWNDESDRTKEQVLAAFDTAIAFARETGA